MTRISALVLLALLAFIPSAAAQQDPPPAAPAAGGYDPERRVVLAQPDFTLVNLPTTLRVPLFKSAFRVTHRFARPLAAGSFGDLAGDLFGLDSGAQIGLEYRFGLVPGGQVGIHRTSNRTIEFFGQYDVLNQGDSVPLGVAALVTIDGTNNFRDQYSTGIGAVISRTFGNSAAIYVEPIFVNNSNIVLTPPGTDDDTFVLGLGARVRVRPTVYLVGEITPRVSGFEPGVNLASFAVEKRAGGHTFQLNFSTGFGTTIAQIARGGTAGEDWYLGFNISRKFF